MNDVVLDDRGRGLVTFSHTAAGVDGAPVLTHIAEVFVRRRLAGEGMS